MKKLLSLICITMVILLLLGSVFACTDGTRKLYFTETTYNLYLSDDNPSVTPEVFTRPRGNDYVLTVSNPTIAKVEGDTIIALKEGMVTLTATSGDMTATATLIVHLMRDATNDDDKTNDGKHSVYFITEYSAISAQRVASGELAIEPVPPVRPGYKLFGWYLDKEFTTPYDFNTPVRNNINLYALWGYASPTYRFSTMDDKTYVSGFEYPHIPYDTAELPATDSNGKVVYGVTSGAFSGNKNLISVTIPGCYQIINNNAFDKMPKLESVTILGEGLLEIEEFAFSECTSLKTVSIGGENLNKIGASSFYGCTALTTINLPNSITEIGASAFYSCKSLSEISLPSSLEVIQANTFAYTALESVDLSGIKAIYNQAFWGATALKTITNPDSIISLGSYVFGSMLSNEQKNATAWLKENSETTTFEGKNGSKATYLGNALVYVSPVGVGTKPLPTYIKQSTATVAGQAFSDISGACAYFIGVNPPTYGTAAFGGGNSASLSPNVDIVVPEGMTETYARAFLITEKDDEGYYSATKYSLSLIQKIYERTQYPTVINGMLMYERYPLVKHEGGLYYSPSLAKEANDPLGGIKYSSEEKYFVLHSYSGTATEIDLKTLLDNDCLSKGYVPVIEKICSYAFSTNTTLQTFKATNNIKYIANYAFAECTKLDAIYLTGEDVTTDNLSASQLETNSFNGTMMPKDFKVYVNGSLLNAYKAKWSAQCPSLRDKFVSVD